MVFYCLKSFKKKKHEKMKKDKGKSIYKCDISFTGDGKFAKIFWALILMIGLCSVSTLYFPQRILSRRASRLKEVYKKQKDILVLFY